MLTAIAHAAKRHWGYPEHWISAWIDELTVTRDYVAAHHVYLAELETEVAGFYALYEAESRWSLDQLWVRPLSIGLGIGRLLYRHALETARRGGCAELPIDSDPNVTGFYERTGAERRGTFSAPMDGCHRERPQYVVRFD
ncbi:MAG: GNAT family N-acetyltransferase [Gemmatimonadota bacterium]|nr:MAG: GNAT family N-acetyltransferase [Gemmatimonadota bacterium]